MATARETAQASLEDLEYWASGLTHTYLRGALERALSLQPEEQLARALKRLEHQENVAVQRAEALTAASSLARQEALQTKADREGVEMALDARVRRWSPAHRETRRPGEIS